MDKSIFHLDSWEEEKEIHQAFRDFIYNETGWKMVYCDGSYVGLTAERYKIFKAGYKKGSTTK